MRSRVPGYYEDETGRFWPRPLSPLRCVDCDRRFLAGALPLDGSLVCIECRERAQAKAEPGLFDAAELKLTSGRNRLPP